MRTIKELRELIADRLDDEIIFCSFWDKSEADEYAEGTMEVQPFTDDEWSDIVRFLNNDDGLWTEMNNTWRYYLDKKINGRNKGNDNSQ